MDQNRYLSEFIYKLERGAKLNMVIDLLERIISL